MGHFTKRCRLTVTLPLRTTALTIIHHRYSQPGAGHLMRHLVHRGNSGKHTRTNIRPHKHLTPKLITSPAPTPTATHSTIPNPNPTFHKLLRALVFHPLCRLTKMPTASSLPVLDTTRDTNLHHQQTTSLEKKSVPPAEPDNKVGQEHMLMTVVTTKDMGQARQEGGSR